MASDYDLHCHSNLSDGSLTPSEVVARAVENGVKTLAITDHDESGAFNLVRDEAVALGLHLIPGVEISTHWHGYDIHLIGLGFDPDHQGLQEGLAGIRQVRQGRAETIAHKLAACNIPGALEGAKAYGTGLIGRLHFARFLVDGGYCLSVQDAFSKYLGKDKRAYAPIDWVPISQAIGWLHDAGGLAVIAHPLRYKMKTKKLRQFIKDFKKLGGDGVEVLTSNIRADSVILMRDMVNKSELYASVGSDFHGPHMPWAELGRLVDLPESCTPIWTSPYFS